MPRPDEQVIGASGKRTLNVVLCLPAAKVSEPRVACYQQMPDARVVLVGHESRPPADDQVALRAWKVPYLGAPERWTASLSWLRGMDAVDPGPVDCVMSMEIYSPASVQARRLAVRLGVPHVVTVSEVLSPAPLYALPPWRNMARSISRSADAFVCSVDLARRSAVAAGCPPDRCVVINPGVDLDRFTPREEGLAPDPVALFVGELREDKGIRQVLAAAEIAQRRCPGLRLVIAGDGPLREEVAAQASRLDFVDYLGKLGHHALPDLYRRARCFVLAPHSRRFWAEQFGFASVEAMASGLPVVITDCGAVREVVPEWNPICPEGDVERLAAGMISAMGSEGAAWGRRNRAAAEQRFDTRQEAAQLRDCLAKLSPSRP
jgi:glycosyltransferase involved in cell wall biosynthesis